MGLVSIIALGKVSSGVFGHSESFCVGIRTFKHDYRRHPSYKKTENDMSSITPCPK